MNMVDKVENEEYYGKTDTEEVDLRRLYNLYKITLFSFVFLPFYLK